MICLTRAQRMKLPTKPPDLHIWKGCHPVVAEASRTFANECLGNEANASVASVRALVRNHLERALIEVAPQRLGSSTRELSQMLGEHGLAGNASKRSEIDDRLRDLVEHFGQRISPEVDTLRTALTRLRWPQPARVAAHREAGLAGARRVKRNIADRSAFEDWPYCELCYRLSVAAAQIENAARSGPVCPESKASARYCSKHESGRGPGYDADFKNKERFQSILRNAFRAINIYPSLRLLFDPPEIDKVWGMFPAARVRYIFSLAKRDLPPFNDYITNVRKHAYFIARQRPATRGNTIRIARLWVDGLSMADIASKIGVSRQSVYSYLQKASGQFSRSSSSSNDEELGAPLNECALGLEMFSIVPRKKTQIR